MNNLYEINNYNCNMGTCWSVINKKNKIMNYKEKSDIVSNKKIKESIDTINIKSILINKNHSRLSQECNIVRHNSYDVPIDSRRLAYSLSPVINNSNRRYSFISYIPKNHTMFVTVN